MFVIKEHRCKFLTFVYNHLTDNGYALIGTMGDEIKKYESDLNDSFKNIKRVVLNNDKKILFLELGVGFDTPGIIRYPFENMTYHFKKANLIRINKGYGFIPNDLNNKSFVFDEDIKLLLRELSK